MLVLTELSERYSDIETPFSSLLKIFVKSKLLADGSPQDLPQQEESVAAVGKRCTRSKDINLSPPLC